MESVFILILSRFKTKLAHKEANLIFILSNSCSKILSYVSLTLLLKGNY